MDDLRLNRTVAPPRSSGGGRSIFVLAIAIAAGLHLLVFGALAFSSGSHTQKALPLPSSAMLPPVAAAAVAQPAAAVAPPSPAPAPPASESDTLIPQPPHPVKPVRHVPLHVHPVAMAKPAPPQKKTLAESRQAKLHAKSKPVKSAPKSVVRHAPAHAKTRPASTLDLNALSRYKPAGK